MYPWIQDGDVLEIQPVTAEDARIGDVLFVELEHGGVLAHRLICKRIEDGRTWLVTKGDALVCSDPPVAADRLLGRVVRLERQDRVINLQNSLLFRILGRVLARWAFIGLRLCHCSVRIRRRLRDWLEPHSGSEE